MADPHRITLPTSASAWLEETFRRNRERFAGWTMEEPPPATPPAADPPPSDPPASDPPPKDPPWGDPQNFNAEKAWELIQNLRSEKGDPAKQTELEQKVAEMTAAQEAQKDALAKALGLKPDDAPPDPTELAEDLAAEQGKTAAAETRATIAERSLAVFMAASDPEHKANAAALLDSTSFLASIAEIDPTDTEKLGAAIKAAVEKNPQFQATPPTPPFPGGPRTPVPTGAGSLGEAVAKKMAATQNR